MHIPLLERELKRGSTELMSPDLRKRRQRHGCEIVRLIGERSDAAISVQVAASYPMLYRHEDRALAEGRWVNTAERPRRRYFLLTSNGQKIPGGQRNSRQKCMLALARARFRHA